MYGNSQKRKLWRVMNAYVLKRILYEKCKEVAVKIMSMTVYCYPATVLSRLPGHLRIEVSYFFFPVNSKFGITEYLNSIIEKFNYRTIQLSKRKKRSKRSLSQKKLNISNIFNIFLPDFVQFTSYEKKMRQFLSVFRWPQVFLPLTPKAESN